MIKVNEEIMKAIAMIEGKGDPIVCAGTTGSGKSTGLEACAKNQVPQDLLAVREASGKGSTSEVSIIATDYEEIPEDKLIIMADVKLKTVADCGDDNELLGNIVYSAAKDYAKNDNDDLYKTKLAKTLTNALQNPANESLAYKIKNMSDSDFGELMDIVLRLPMDEVMICYNEMLARNTKKGQNGVRIFIELISARESFAEIIQAFWSFVVTLINQDVEGLKDILMQNGACVELKENGSFKFSAVLGEEDIESDIADILLRSEDGSKEYLLSNISMIFRGAEYIFKVENRDLLTVSEMGDVKIHCVRIIDTQGLFHVTGVKAKEESERIVDLLSEYHSNRLLLVVNSFVNDTVKNGYEAICMMLQDVNRDVEVYILYTHWDEYLKSYANQNTEENRFSKRGRISIDWEEKFNIAEKEQEILTKRFVDAVAENTSKNKPQIVGTYRASILADSESKMEDVLEDNDIDYPDALNKMLSDTLKLEASRGKRYRVIEGMENCISIDKSALGKQNISALYDNLVVECKDLKLYASTVRASDRKWRNSGTVHVSYVVANDYGFQNISTKFVQEIRNYAMSYVKKMNIDVSSFITNQNDVNRFIEDLLAYLSLNQNVGREVAKIIGDEAYSRGFVKEPGFKYQYQRFNDMLQYAQDSYFTSRTIVFTDAFEKCLLEATRKCVRNFIDAKCIVVY